jgi:hypothetical protein
MNFLSFLNEKNFNEKKNDDDSKNSGDETLQEMPSIFNKLNCRNGIRKCNKRTNKEKQCK